MDRGVVERMVTRDAMTDAFVHQMQRLAGLKFAPADLGTHWAGLQGVPPDDLARGVTAAIRQCDSFPSPAELRRFVSGPWRTAWSCPHVEHCDHREMCQVKQLMPAKYPARVTGEVTR